MGRDSAAVRLLERRFTVEAPLERVWEHLERVESWPTWARHIRSVDLTPAGPLGMESEGVIKLTNGIRSTFRMVDLQPGVSWKWVGPFLWITVHYDHQFQRLEANRTEVRFVLDGEGVGVRSLGRIFARVYGGNLDRAIPNLIAEIEGAPVA